MIQPVELIGGHAFKFINEQKYLTEGEKSILSYEKSFIISIIGRISQNYSFSGNPSRETNTVELLADTGVSRVFLVNAQGKRYVIKRSSATYYNKYIHNQWKILRELNPEYEIIHIAKPLLIGEETILFNMRPNQIAYLVTNHFQGKDLEACVNTEGAFDKKRLISFGLSLANLLNYIHSKGVIVRELKPANIMIMADGSVSLYDFNVSMLIDYDWEKDMHQFKDTVRHDFADDGWEYFTRPSERPKPDGQSDIFSLGMDLFYAATGNVYYQGKHREKVGLEYIKDSQLRFIIGKAIGSRDVRYHSAEELIEDLQRLSNSVFSPSSPIRELNHPVNSSPATKVPTSQGRNVPSQTKSFSSFVLRPSSLGFSPVSSPLENMAGIQNSPFHETIEQTYYSDVKGKFSCF